MPLLVRGPEVAAGSTTGKLALNTEFFPAFTDLGDADDPSAHLERIASEPATAQSELENAAKYPDRLKELENQRALFPESARAVVRRLDRLTPKKQLDTYRFLNLGIEAIDGVVSCVKGDFKRIGVICTDEFSSSAASATT